MRSQTYPSLRFLGLRFLVLLSLVSAPVAAETPVAVPPKTSEAPYTSEGKRDPFAPMDLSGESGQPGSSPLERYSLNQLRVTAVVIDERLGSTAVIEDSSGRGYSVKLGSRVGERNGTVVGIVADRVTVLQRTVDFSGREHSERVELKLLPPTKRDRKR